MPDVRLIELPTVWTVLLDVLAWLVIHLAVAFGFTRIPAERFDPLAWPFKPGAAEASGRFYPQLAAIRFWKRLLPDAAGLFGKRGFRKKVLAGRDSVYLEAFARETCRAELTHWSFMPFAPLFFLWNPPGAGVTMLIYIVLENLPIILAQRYNRARLLRLLDSRSRRALRKP